MPETRTRRSGIWPRTLRLRLTHIWRSLTVRVIAFSSLWAIIALVAIATVISTLFRQVSERGFDSVLSAHLYNVIGSVGISETGGLSGYPNLDDLRFSQPGSGWYWSVEPVGEAGGGSLRSTSMSAPVPSPSTEAVPFNDGFQRSYIVDGPNGHQLEIVEAELVLGEGDKVARFRIMGNRTDLETEIRQFARRLYSYLTLFGLGMIAINVFAILYGLRPLNRVGQALSDIRAGTARRLAGPFPREIASLADETNALIENNRRIVERSRKQVGNLAHSLKTPLAVLLNEARAMGGERGELIATQASALQKQLDHYLQRARAAAQRDGLVFRTPVRETVQRMARVVQKLNPAMRLDVSLPDETLIFAGEREDFEEIIGNLLENAMKWATACVAFSVLPVEPGDEGEAFFEVRIEDDGLGIPDEKAREAIKRGRRLDESKPGSGLGLAIVTDLVEEYGGELILTRSDMGGLKAIIRLPTAEG